MGENRGSMTLAMFVTALLMVVSSECNFASAGKGPQPLKFTYYLHDNFVPPDLTAVQVASANGTFTNAGLFGDLYVFASPLRQGMEKDSPLLGFAGGEIAYIKGLNFVTFVHNVNLPNHVGTISASAIFNITVGTWEVGISAGTGSFRGAQGFFTVTVVDPSPLGYILKYAATVFLSKWAI